jgi:hypothetical protein
MDNASKNASDMIGSLQMQYNRGRQASITNELVDIITGSWLSLRFIQEITDTRSRCQRFVISENSLESGIESVARCYPVVSRFPSPLIAVWACSPKKVLSALQPPLLPTTSNPERVYDDSHAICVPAPTLLQYMTTYRRPTWLRYSSGGFVWVVS